MKNIAKCAKCQEVIESFAKDDVVFCKCEEIAIWGGQVEFNAYAKDWKNFLRIDENGCPFPVKFKDKDEKPKEESQNKLTKREKLEMLKEMIKNIERLPSNAMSTPVTHYDLYSSLALVSSILEDEHS